jgi:hypothetical protein
MEHSYTLEQLGLTGIAQKEHAVMPQVHRRPNHVRRHVSVGIIDVHDRQGDIRALGLEALGKLDRRAAAATMRG